MCLMLLIYYKLHRNPADAAQSVPQVFISQKTNFLSREPSDLFFTVGWKTCKDSNCAWDIAGYVIPDSSVLLMASCRVHCFRKLWSINTLQRWPKTGWEFCRTCTGDDCWVLISRFDLICIFCRHFTFYESFTVLLLTYDLHIIIINIFLKLKVQWMCLCVFTSQEVPAYPGGQEQISTADARLSPLAEGSAICIENEWSLRTYRQNLVMGFNNKVVIFTLQRVYSQAIRISCLYLYTALVSVL